ncbi:MAG TPA: hypothetical protein VM433_02200 [Mycobacteriales bacterium]|nr:hypothetical protein [Mycobacteriales bacterium]
MTSTGQAAGAAQQAAGTTATTAKDEAAATAQSAASAAADVAGTATEQVGQVAGEAVDQVRQLAEQARSQLSEQAGNANQKLSESLRQLAGEVRDMSQGDADGSGTVAGLAQQLADKGEQLAEHISRQGPGGLLQELRGFAARKPGTFLLGALAAGVVTGRVVKGATAGAGSTGSPTGSAGTGTGSAAGADVVAVVEPMPVTEAEIASGAPVTAEPYPATSSGGQAPPPVNPLAGGAEVDPLAARDPFSGSGTSGFGTGVR